MVIFLQKILLNDRYWPKADIRVLNKTNYPWLNINANKKSVSYRLTLIIILNLIMNNVIKCE